MSLHGERQNVIRTLRLRREKNQLVPVCGEAEVCVWRGPFSPSFYPELGSCNGGVVVGAEFFNCPLGLCNMMSQSDMN